MKTDRVCVENLTGVSKAENRSKNLTYLNAYLSLTNVQESVTEAEWDEMTFHMKWEEKDAVCKALMLEKFAVYLKARECVSEQFWTLVTTVIGGSLHNFCDLNQPNPPPPIQSMPASLAT